MGRLPILSKFRLGPFKISLPRCLVLDGHFSTRTQTLTHWRLNLVTYDETPVIKLPESDDDLLRECEVETFRSSGPGGQHVNKTESAVRLRHLPSGVVVSSQQQRSQHQNKADCLRKLRQKIERLNYRPARRVPTRRSRSAKNRTLEDKSRRSQIKRLRAKPSPDE